MPYHPAWSATRPRLAAVGASSREVAQAFFPAIRPRPAGPRYPASKLGSHPRPWPCWRMRGRVTFCRSQPWWIAQRRAGCTGRAGRCSRPGRRFGFRRRRAPSVRHRRRGVCHCASAQPCLHCSPTQAGQTLLGLAIPAGRGRCGRVGSVAGCPGHPLLWVLVDTVAAGLAGRGPEGSAPPAPARGRLPGQPRTVPLYVNPESSW
jgi:hypothetical protein